jgi:hypothetical protein
LVAGRWPEVRAIRPSDEPPVDDLIALAGAVGILQACRWQYIVSRVQHPHFGRLLTSMTPAGLMARIGSALAPILGA